MAGATSGRRARAARAAFSAAFSSWGTGLHMHWIRTSHTGPSPSSSVSWTSQRAVSAAGAWDITALRGVVERGRELGRDRVCATTRKGLRICISGSLPPGSAATSCTRPSPSANTLGPLGTITTHTHSHTHTPEEVDLRAQARAVPGRQLLLGLLLGRGAAAALLLRGRGIALDDLHQAPKHLPPAHRAVVVLRTQLQGG